MKREKNGDFKFLKKRILTGLLLGTAMLIPLMPSVYALPSEGTYASTNLSTVTTTGNVMDITGTKTNNVLNWDTFSIASEETVNFTDSNNYLNLVNGIRESTIYGALNGDGNIYLVNPNGIIFGSNATINVGSLVASTRDITTSNITDFENGSNPITNSTIDSLSGNITNLGNIQANSVVLEGNEVIIQNATNVSSSNVTIKALADITVGHKVENQIDLDETIGTTNNAADYGNAVISSSGYTGTDLAGEHKDITEAFLVEDVYDLQNMNANLTANYLLASDIDASDTSNWIDGFTPVGSENTTESYWQREELYTTFWGKTFYYWVEYTTTTINTFEGSFNGAGNIINGLTINKSEDNVGLFGYVDNASIKNVGLGNDSSISGDDNVGGIIGFVDGDTTISNLFNAASISGKDNVGGLVGFVDEDIEMDDLFNVGSSVSGNDNVGGLVGSVDGDLVMSTSLNLGSISGNDNVGGAVGFVDGDTTLSTLFNGASISGNDNVGGLVGAIDGDTTLSNLFNSDSVSGNDNVGGLVGSVDGDLAMSTSLNLGSISGNDNVGGAVGGVYSGMFNDSNIAISSSYNSGNVSASSESNLLSQANVGGLVGGLEGFGDIEISNSYNTGDVSFSGDNVVSESNVGGLIGGLVGIGDIEISNSYNTGDVSSNESNLLGESNVGGLVGGLVGFGTITADNSYYATTDSNGNEINQDSNDYGNAKTYTEMLQASTYAFSDDIDTIGGEDKVWRMYDGYTTPLLKSFMQTVEIVDPTDIYNGEEQIGKVVTLDGRELINSIYGNVGTNSGVYTLYSSQLGYDLVNSTGIATPVYTISSLESLVEGEKEDYNTVIGVSKMKTFTRPTFEMVKQQQGLKKEAQIINNSKPLLGADETFYDNENNSVVIFNN